MNIPTKTECFELIRDMKMLDHIVVHSILVCRVALLLTDRINFTGSKLNRDLVRASALLHDITKTRSFDTGELHSETGCQLLTDKGFPETGSIVRQHVKLDTYFTSEVITEAEIVNYADKRVLHDRIVSMKTRMQYIIKTYGNDRTKRKLLMALWEDSNKMEKRIFKQMTIRPKEVGDLIDRGGYASELGTYKLICSK